MQLQLCCAVLCISCTGGNGSRFAMWHLCGSACMYAGAPTTACRNHWQPELVQHVIRMDSDSNQATATAQQVRQAGKPDNQQVP